MKMIKMSQNQQKIVNVLSKTGEASSSKIREELLKGGEDISLVTVKRTLSEMLSLGTVKTSGVGRATTYTVSALGRIFVEIDAKIYCSVPPDERFGLKKYNFDLLPGFPDDVFFDNELQILNDATSEYNRRTKDLSETIQKKELERLTIELSWKSSKIEGNTYTLLDTEKLILENKEAPGHDRQEAVMILNHKSAFNFIYQNRDRFKTLNRANMEELHALLVKDMEVNLGLRVKPVGVLGSIYSPLDNIHQITEAVETLSKVVSKISNPYAKSMVALLGISYIQPFEDGNKRTGRLMANALLLANGLAPLSYRSVKEEEFRAATLVFYELNSVMPFKKIFVEQYAFAANNYAVR